MRAATLRAKTSAMRGSVSPGRRAVAPVAAAAGSATTTTATRAAAAAAPKGADNAFLAWQQWSEKRAPPPESTLKNGLVITPALGKAICAVATTASARPQARAAAAAPAAARPAAPAAPPPPPPPPGPAASLLADLATRPLPEGMHALLRSVAQAQLQAWLDAPAGAGGGFAADAAASQALAAARTTTDISAAVELVAAVVPGDGYPDKKPRAVLSLVACETERAVTWSRLEGLFAHWAVAGPSGKAAAGGGGAGGAWAAAPYGWRSAPALSHDAGGGAAWQSAFERHAVSMPGSDAPAPIYGLLLEVPVSGVLTADGAGGGGGVVFVLKSGDKSESTQATRWLREQPAAGGEARDFFVEVSKLPKLSKK